MNREISFKNRTPDLQQTASHNIFPAPCLIQLIFLILMCYTLNGRMVANDELGG
jgi:hypothetical protein